MAANSYNPLVQPSQPLLRAPPQSPTAPRTMLAQSPTEEHKRTISSLESALFERILLLNVLVDFSGPHVDRGSVKDTVASSEQEFRRDFLDKIVYLCDIEKGGPTVTGSALQELQRCNVLWLAANEGISDNVMKFIDRVLVQLKNLTPDNRKAVENGIFGEAVRCAVHRISFYQLQLVKFATICRKTLAKFKEDSEVALRSWLKSLIYIKGHKSHQELVLTCYKARSTKVPEIKKRIEQPLDAFDELAHYVWRIGAHRQAVLTVVEAWSQVPSLKKIDLVRKVPPADTRRIEHPTGSINPYKMVMDICRRLLEPNAAQKCLNAFTDIDFKRDLESLMAEKSSNLHRVHAELLILEEFGRHDHKFVDNDRYIGCSKGACYFCYKWIVLHPKNFVSPASHNKVLLGCGGLDQDLNISGATHYQRQLEKVIGAVEQDIIRHLDSHSVVIRHHLSTNGSSRAPSTRAS